MADHLVYFPNFFFTLAVFVNKACVYYNQRMKLDKSFSFK